MDTQYILTIQPSLLAEVSYSLAKDAVQEETHNGIR